MSSHELSFLVNVTVPKSGNYSFAARPASSGTATAGSASSASGGADGGSGRRLRSRRRQLEETAAAESSSSQADGPGNGDDDDGDDEDDEDDDTVTMRWEVDLTRPETLVVSRPSPVTTAGVAVFEFACALDGQEPPRGCFYQYQMMGVNADTDWDSLDWLPTVGEKRDRETKPVPRDVKDAVEYRRRVLFYWGSACLALVCLGSP